MRLAGEREGRSTTSETHCASRIIVGGNPRRPTAKAGRTADRLGFRSARADYGCQSHHEVLKEDSPMDILYRLKQPLVMSMFASKNHLYQEGEAQRAGAADEIKRLRRALALISNYTNDEHVQGICRGYLGGGDHG